MDVPQLIVLATRPDPNGDGEVIGPQEDQSDQPSDEGNRDVREINRHEQERQGENCPSSPF